MISKLNIITFSKYSLFGLAGLLICLTACAPSRGTMYTESRIDSYAKNYTVLNGHGRWINHDRMDIVWLPYVVRDWRPYHYGNWVWSDYGWTWISYEPYGWLVYHYGFWDYDSDLGWVWIPDNMWSPARVMWYVYDDYVCWAPTPPPGRRRATPWDPTYRTAVWTIVPINNFASDNVGRYNIRNFTRRDAIAVSRDAPSLKYIQSRTRTSIKKTNLRQEKVDLGGKKYDRIRLQERDAQRIKPQRDEVERTVLRQPEKKQEQKKEKTKRRQ